MEDKTNFLQDPSAAPMPSSEAVSPEIKISSKISQEEKLKILMEEARKFNELPEEEQDLTRRQLFNKQMETIGRIWEGFSRKKKRSLTSPSMKYSQRVKRRLK